MRYRLTLCLLLLAACVLAQIRQPVDYVNPLIDTHQSRWFYFSSASRPFGMVNLSPDTNVRGSWESGYLYDSTVVRCFSHVHAWQLAGVPVMPTTGEMRGHLGMDSTLSTFSHATEQVSPGYHRLHLDRYGIDVELTSTTRVGLHRYRFADDGQPRHLLFDTGAFLAHDSTDYSMVRRVSPTELEGYVILGPTHRRPKPVRLYFIAHTDAPAAAFGGWRAGSLVPGLAEGPTDSLAGKDIGAYLTFADTLTDLQLKVALSYTSLSAARANLAAELDHWDFDRVRQDARAEWNAMLGRIEVSGGTEARHVKFYTDLWHALLGRRIISDADGSYPDNTGGVTQVRKSSHGYPHYNFDAWWGSHWSLNQLWSLAYPEIMDGFCNTMVDMYRNGGLIPRGPSGGNYTYVMIGDPAASFFAAALNKGIDDYDVEAAYAGLRKNAFVGGIRDHAGYEHRTLAFGGGMQYYEERGYVPEGIEGPGGHKDGASMTLEYAYQDWCLAQIARRLGKQEDHDFFLQRSQNYRKLWNPATGYMHPREMDGSWMEDFQPVVDDFNARGFCEANSAIYTHYVPHDLPGLMELFGGRQTYLDSLNGSFEKAEQDWLKAAGKVHAANWVDYGNQPGTAMAHLFNVAGAPWLSQRWVRAIKDTYADTTAYGGYHGDEDQGQMGALGVLMAIGLFSVDGSAAAEPSYQITTPVFKEIIVHLSPDYYTGDTFTIRVAGEPEEELYIRGATLDGQAWSGVDLPFDRVSGGGVLELTTDSVPHKNWGR
ncbi:hypothetical protein LEM8419_03324 [Neolewinella maritima]|uniref:Glycoside hydrolase family 92 protein n=1 Tax=Neolewinella maritima TaxID=1383882 RepID=A0ABN8F773_9BACT|nr:GH92 family glycosyl hydrolase [Neolewinella maritima]CAH1002445.1 hypothetical protein LEM8419_03324 [Neolewinella maritima]